MSWLSTDKQLDKADFTTIIFSESDLVCSSAVSWFCDDDCDLIFLRLALFFMGSHGELKLFTHCGLHCLRKVDKKYVKHKVTPSTWEKCPDKIECSNNPFFSVFVYSYVPYAKLHCAQSGMCAFRLYSRLSGFDWGMRLTCGCRHLPQTGAMTLVMPAE